jgi:hypothetical protein
VKKKKGNPTCAGGAVFGEEIDCVKYKKLRSLAADRYLQINENRDRYSGLAEQQRISMKAHMQGRESLSSSPLSVRAYQLG